MKHSPKETLMLTGLLLIAVAYGFVFTHIVPGRELPDTIQSTWGNALFVIAVVLIGAITWWLIFKHIPRANIASTIYPLTTAFVCTAIVEELLHTTFWVRVATFLIVYAIQASIVHQIKHNTVWRTTSILANNIFVIVVIMYLAAVFANTLSLAAALIVFVALAIYDAVAVWKFKTMQSMATNMVREGVIPCLAIPKANSNKSNKKTKTNKPNIAMLGGGDIFIVGLVGGTAYLYNASLGAAMTGGMVGTIIGLFIGAKKDVFYPALPFMLSGAIVGAASFAMVEVGMAIIA